MAKGEEIIVNTPSGPQRFNRSNTILYHYDENSMYDHIRKVEVQRNMEKTTAYFIWSLGRGCLELADILVQNHFTRVVLAEVDDLAKEALPMHFHNEVQLAEVALQGWINEQA